MDFLFRLETFISLLLFLVDIVYCSEEKDSDSLQIQINTEQQDYVLCSDLELTCAMNRSITAESEKIIWLLNDTIISYNERISAKIQNCSSDISCSILTVRCLQLLDVGNYTCRPDQGDNKVFTVVSSPYYVSIDVPTVIKSEGAVVKANENVSIKCIFKSVDSNTVKWSKVNDDSISDQLKNGVYTSNNGTITESILTINAVNLRNHNGTYKCSASKTEFEISEYVSLIVRDVPDVTIHTVKVVGPNQIFLNWTVNDGNDKMENFFIQYFKIGGADWTYYDENIGGANTSYIMKNLHRGSTYKLKISGKNSIGQGHFHEWPYSVTTLKDDVIFIPEPYVKGVTGNSIEIGWSPPPMDLKEHIHFYKLFLRNNETREETVQHVERSNSYMFINLQFAKMYFIKVAACNEFTNDCGNWSKEINGTTLDGVSDPPEITNVTCKYDNISGSSLIRVAWSPPEHVNGEITYYNVSLIGTARFYNEDGELKNVTWIPDFKTTRSNFIIFERVPPNTNYSISVSVKTRNNVNGKQAVTHCIIPPTVPSKERLNSIKWEKIQEQDRWYLKLFMPRISERNGTICCYRIFLIRLKPEQGLADLPSPKEATVSSYYHVHKSDNGGGAYMADMFDNNFNNENIVLGDGYSVAKNNSNSQCYKCPIADLKIAPIKSLTTRSNAQPISVSSSSSSLISTSSVLPSVPNANKIPEKSISYSDRNVASDSGINDDYTYVLNSTIDDGILDENSNYTGFLQLIVYGSDDKFMTAYSNYFDILKPSSQMFLGQYQDLEILSVLLQVLIAFGCIGFVILIGFCMLQHYTRQVAEAQGVEMTLRNSFRHLCRSLRGSHIPVSSNPPDILPILKQELLTRYLDLSKDSDYGFEIEFEMLPDRFADRTTKASEARENVCKNRYPDIKAYDQTRVKLPQIDGIIGSDYINANFVIGYKERKKFICAQGPMENTVCDFWRMIWEQQLEIILMLTNLEEYSKTKCAKYWPDKEEQSKTFGDINVHYIEDKRYSDYVIRELKVIYNGGQMKEPEERSIYQYHFLVWKDFQAPEHPAGILKFIQRVNEAYSYEKGPILVHCSAGVGRTGTLVALDSLLQQLTFEGEVLVFNTICDLRRQRNFLVQSLKQYIFVYRCLLEYVQFGDTDIKVSHLKSTVEKLKQCDNGKITTRMEEEFEKLSFVLTNQEVKSTAVGGAQENSPKNRDKFLIPYDRNRVILTPVPGCEHSTYINASFIEGYENSESFIITQDPILETTVIDFWRMISEQNVTTIVMLSSLQDGQNRCSRYWPDEEFQYGNVNVKHVQSESCPYYTRREFYVTNVKTDENLVVTQYQYNGWPTVDGEVPEVTRGMIELVDNTTLKNSNVVNASDIVNPVVVHCYFGSDRSSMFVALSIIAVQLKVERRVDIATITRKLRSQRRGMLDTFAQYEFLYRAALNYVDLHHLADPELF